MEAEFYLSVPVSTLSQVLAPHLPVGMRILDAKAIPPGVLRLSDFDIVSTYLVRPIEACALPEEITTEFAKQRFAAFLKAKYFPLALVRESQVTEVELRPIVDDLRVNDGVIFIRIIQGTGKSVRPAEAASAILGVCLSPETLFIRKETAELTPRHQKK
jgi:hypothetical protein